tara:strand:- start:430 stop:2010 length:1581 start_codon:yes stop_codon:yes gene_type:complete
MALTKVTYSMIDSSPVNIMDWIPQQYHAAIKDFSSTVPVQSYIQAAMDSGAGSIYFPMGWYVIASALYVTQGNVGSNQAANLTFVGENRTSTYFVGPGSANFTPAGFNNPALGTPVRSMIINQANNGKFSLKNLRFQGDIGSGHAVYSVEDGVNSQCLFSGVIEDCWFSLSATNNGVFMGALQNFVVANNTFESAKGCFRLTGVGTGDVHFSNNSVYSCYDGFLDGTLDSNSKLNITVQGLNVYSYLRGPVFSANNAQNWQISDVNLEGDAAAIADVGICDFTNSSGITIDGFSAYGVLHDVLKIAQTTIKISNGFITANVSGVKIGNNSSNVTIDNVNITGSSVAAFYHATGNPSGIVRISNCSWNNCGGNMWVDQSGVASYDVFFENSQFINAGFPSTSAGTRNFAITTSGNVNFYNCLIGRSAATAIANYYIDASGTGDLILTDCTFTTLAAPISDFVGTQVFKIAGGLGNRYRQYYASASPTTGTWNVGDRVFNTVPSIGQPKGWLCTVAGTPGTWVSEGNL